MERLRHIAEVGLGILLAATPLALWIVWTPAMVVWVMLAAAASAALLVLLTESSQRSVPVRDSREGAASTHGLPEEFIEEVHRLFPLTYHHSLRMTPRFRQAMSRLSEMMERGGLDKAPR